MNRIRIIRRVLAPVTVLTLATILTGCGGSGTPSSTTLLSKKVEIATSIQQGFSARSNVSRTNAARSRSARTVAQTRGGTYFDEFYGLYARPVEAGVDYFVDEALTQAAGTERSTTTTTETNGFAQSSTIEITAGKLKGYKLTYLTAISGSQLTLSISGTDPNTGQFEIEGKFEDGAGDFSSRYTDKGVLRTYLVSFKPDGTSKVTFNTGSNFIYTLNYAADGSGSGTVTGENSLLPAQIVWNTSGDGEMTFADQSKLEIRNFDFVQF
jgi:hypothetical protein